MIAWASFRLTQNPVYPVTPVLAPFLIAPPVIDCLTLIARRIAHRRSPFAADRTHVHHLMQEGGFTPTGVVLALSAASLALGLGAAVALLADVPIPLFMVAFLAATAAWFTLSERHARAVAVFAAIHRLVVGSPAAPAAAPPADKHEPGA